MSEQTEQWCVCVCMRCLECPRRPDLSRISRGTLVSQDLRMLAQTSDGPWAMGRDKVSRWSSWRSPSSERAGPVRFWCLAGGRGQDRCDEMCYGSRRLAIDACSIALVDRRRSRLSAPWIKRA
eukprot:360380-Chlamydomonas_euryale.AAC.7